MTILDSISGPKDLRELSLAQLEKLAGEIRQLIVDVVSRQGGHLSSNLGVVELTIALHRCFDFLKDRLIWDVGHQTYANKILTGRREAFGTLRQKGGVSGFARPSESPYDVFHFGHAGTSVSAALGMACAGPGGADQRRRVVVVIGDGAIASGMPFEALNHAGAIGKDLLVILNDNRMSISPSVGAVARHLSKVRSSTPYVGVKREVHELMSRWPEAREGFEGLLGRLAEGIQAALTPGGLFVELGFRYYGPVDGHELGELMDTLGHMKRIGGPVLLHVLTKKGQGFEPAREDPAAYHSSGRFTIQNGEVIKQSPMRPAGSPGGSEPSPTGTAAPERSRSYSEAVGQALVDLARDDPRLVAITAAMPEGTGLTPFARRYPDRFYDVGICEQHAVGLAGGLAAGGLRPVVCIYSTFLQRAYDQVFHDVALQGAPVVFCVDRGGLVGSDGPTHHGLYDVAYLRTMPGFIVMAPANEAELRAMLSLALSSDRPCAIRYPREEAPDLPPADEQTHVEVGRADVLSTGDDGAIIAYGAMARRALEAAEILEGRHGRRVSVVNARFAKPLDEETIFRVVRACPAVLIAEDHALAGGFGSAVLEALAARGIGAGHVRAAGVPDRLIEHATREEQLSALRLDGPGLAERLLELMATPGAASNAV